MFLCGDGKRNTLNHSHRFHCSWHLKLVWEANANQFLWFSSKIHKAQIVLWRLTGFINSKYPQLPEISKNSELVGLLFCLFWWHFQQIHITKKKYRCIFGIYFFLYRKLHVGFLSTTISLSNITMIDVCITYPFFWNNSLISGFESI